MLMLYSQYLLSSYAIAKKKVTLVSTEAATLKHKEPFVNCDEGVVYGMPLTCGDVLPLPRFLVCASAWRQHIRSK